MLAALWAIPNRPVPYKIAAVPRHPELLIIAEVAQNLHKIIRYKIARRRDVFNAHRNLKLRPESHQLETKSQHMPYMRFFDLW
jgi:hypothetical protein